MQLAEGNIYKRMHWKNSSYLFMKMMKGFFFLDIIFFGILFAFSDTVQTNALQDFGFNLLSIDKIFNGRHIEITVKLRVPPNTDHYWSFNGGFIPVLDQDRYSSVENLLRDGIITSRLHTTEVDVGYIYFKAFTQIPYYRGIVLLLKSTSFPSSRNYSHSCAFALPSHIEENDKVSLQTTFQCNMISGQDTSPFKTGIRYYAEALDRNGTTGTSIASFTDADRNLTIRNNEVIVTKTITKDRSFIDGFGGVLSVFEMKMDTARRDDGPLHGLRMYLEDDKSFDGSRNNPFLPGVFAEYFFTVNHGILMAKRRQSYIYCRAIGYKVPNVEVFKVANDGSDLSLTFPKLIHSTKFSTAVYYVLNYPTENDAGQYVCRTRVDGLQKSFTFNGYFEPEVPPEIERSRSGIVFKFYSYNIQLFVKSPEDVSINCYIGSRTGSKINERPISWWKTQKTDRTRLTEYYIDWPMEGRQLANVTVYCKASNRYGADWIEINKDSRL